jgi:hypothetical protein
MVRMMWSGEEAWGGGLGQEAGGAQACVPVGWVRRWCVKRLVRVVMQHTDRNQGARGYAAD